MKKKAQTTDSQWEWNDFLMPSSCRASEKFKSLQSCIENKCTHINNAYVIGKCLYTHAYLYRYANGKAKQRI